MTLFGSTEMTWNLRIIELALACVFFLGIQANAQAQSDLTASPPASYAYPLLSAPPIYSFLVSSTTGKVDGVSAKVLEVRDPSGVTINPDAIRISPEAMSVDTTGRPVVFQLDSRYFAQPGTYQGRVLLAATTLSRPVSVALTIIHPPALVNGTDLTNRSVQLIRWFPGMSTRGTIQYTLTETSRKSDLEDTQLEAGQIFNDHGVLNAGTVTLGFLRRPADLPGSPMTISAGLGRQLTVHLHSIAGAGAYTANWFVTSPSLNGREVVSLKVGVTDFWIYPFITILLGVILAAWIRYLIDTETPQLANRISILRLQVSVQAASSRTSNTDKAEQLKQILDIIEEAKGLNEDGNFVDAQAKLATAAKVFSDFQSGQAKEAATDRANIADLKSRLDKLRSNETQQQALANIDALLKSASDALDADRVDDATTAIGNAEISWKSIPLELRGQSGVKSMNMPLKQGDIALSPSWAITIDDPLSCRRAKSPITFRIKTDDANDYRYHWYFGDAAAGRTSEGMVVEHTYKQAGDYCVKAEIYNTSKPPKLVDTTAIAITVGMESATNALAEARRQRAKDTAVVTCISVVLATILGMLTKYAGANFGTLQDYGTVFLWGFGLDASLKGFLDVKNRLTRPAA